MNRSGAARSGVALALLSSATFATSGTFASTLLDAGWSSVAAVTFRIGIAALVLALPAALSLRGRWRTLRGSAGMIAVYGLFAVAGAQVCYFNAVRYLPVGIALLLEYLGLVLVVIWMWAMHGQRPRRLTLGGSVIAILGLICVLDLTGTQHVQVAGVLWGLGAAVGLALYFVLSARADDGLPALVLASGGMAIGAVALAAIGLLGLMPMHATLRRRSLRRPRGELAAPGRRAVAGRGRGVVRGRHQRRAHPGRPAVIVPRTFRGRLRSRLRLAVPGAAAHAGPDARRRPDRRWCRPGAAR